MSNYGESPRVTVLRRFASHIKRRILERRLGASPAFVPEYYRRQLPDNGRSLSARSALWRHYLEVGAFEGFDPNPEFDSDWYLATHPDVVATGLNPLVHYELYGKREGRSPYLGAPVYLPEAPKLDERTYWYFRLWGGFEHLVLPELRQRAEGENTTARWLLAEWEYAHGNLDAATALVDPKTAPEPALQKLGHPAASELPEWSEQWHHMGALRGDDVGHPADAETERDNGPLVSVVVSSFNSAEHLPRALDGLLNQTWSNLEIIVVDDASTDNTAEVVGDIARTDDRVHYLPNERNMGAYPSRNRGMKAALGDFVTVHDADDWSFPEKIATQLKPLQDNPKLVATGSVWVRVTGEGQPVGSWMLGEPFLEPNHSAWLIRRSALDAVGLWDNVNVAADTEFLWRLEHHYGHQALRRVCLDKPLSLALSDESTLTRTKATHVRTVFYGLRRLYREASSWWHRTSAFKPVMSDERPFPVPLGNLKRPTREFDVVVAANFAVRGAALEAVLDVIKVLVKKGESLCLLHWPDFDAWHGNAVADEVFQLAQDQGLGFVHPGFQVTAPTVVFLSPELWRKPPTQTVVVEGLKQVVGSDSTLCASQQELLRYFGQGGVANAQA